MMTVVEDDVVVAGDFFVMRAVLEKHLIMEEDCIGSNHDNTALAWR